MINVGERYDRGCAKFIGLTKSTGDGTAPDENSRIWVDVAGVSLIEGKTWGGAVIVANGVHMTVIESTADIKALIERANAGVYGFYE